MQKLWQYNQLSLCTAASLEEIVEEELLEVEQEELLQDEILREEYEEESVDCDSEEDIIHYFECYRRV